MSPHPAPHNAASATVANVRLLCGIATLLLSASPLSANPWAEATEPYPATESSARPIGGYSAGCLAGADALAFNGRGFQVMRLSRRRYFGHPELVRFIEALGEKADRAGLGTVLIGDLAQPRGGPMLSGHRSHQTGLDVDVWYWLNSPATARLLSAEEREALHAPSMLAPGGSDLDLGKWSSAHTDLLKLAAEDTRVERIFVNPAIKRHLCRTASTLDRDWLGKLRPWWGHDDHFHVRLKCPDGHAECAAQEAVETGTGCDQSLDWWFTAEAKQVPAAPKAEALPVLPTACATLIEPGRPLSLTGR